MRSKFAVWLARLDRMLEWTDTHTFRLVHEPDLVIYLSAAPCSYPWRLMVEAAYRKYPNPHSPQVHSLDTVERRASGRRLYSHRLFCTLWNIPTLVLKVREESDDKVTPECTLAQIGYRKLKKMRYLLVLAQIVGSNPLMQVNEQSVCDLDEKTLIIRARNVSRAYRKCSMSLPSPCRFLCQTFSS